MQLFLVWRFLVIFAKKNSIMTAQLVLQFDNADDLMRVLQFLKDSGLEKLTFKKRVPRKKTISPEKRDWSWAGSVSLGGKLDHVNIRDYAHED